MQELKEP